MVANYFPMYQPNLGGPQQIIEVMARQAGNKNEMEKYLDEKYITLLLKKINFLEEELKQKLIYVDDLQYEEELKSKKTR